MIWESSHWKQPLARDAEMIERWAAKPGYSERRSALLERKIMLSAFAMRKLSESLKLSSSFDDRSISVMEHKAMPGRNVDFANSHRIDVNYDLSSGERRNVGVPWLLDQIIHSLTFAEWNEDDGSVSGFLVSSDKERQRSVMCVRLPDFVKLMRLVAKDYPDNGIQVRDPDTNVWFTWRGNGMPPRHIRTKIDALRKKYTP